MLGCCPCGKEAAGVRTHQYLPAAIPPPVAASRSGPTGVARLRMLATCSATPRSLGSPSPPWYLASRSSGPPSVSPGSCASPAARTTAAITGGTGDSPLIGARPVRADRSVERAEHPYSAPSGQMATQITYSGLAYAL